MKQLMNKKSVLLLFAAVMVLFALCAGGRYLYITKADNNATASPVSLAGLDFNSMEITLDMNGNAILYYSTNRKTWNEADSTMITDSNGKNQMLYDISWVSMSGKATLYFRGNLDRTTCAVPIPAYNKKFKAKFDKTDGTFDFENTEGVEIIRWRKITDYAWNYIWAEHGKAEQEIKGVDTDPYYKKYGITGKVQKLEDFESDVMRMRVKGTKLMFQMVPMARIKDVSDGAPPSKEVKVSIPALKAAPNIKVNVKKLTVNSTEKQQWSTTRSSIDTNWQNCTKAMSIESIAPEAASGSAMQTVYFRTAATSSASASKVTTLEIPARAAAPEAPFSYNPVAATAKKKATATLSFSNVPSAGYQYVVVKAGTLDETTARWKAVKKAKNVKFNERQLPAGSIIYVRTAGVAKNVNKNIDLQLPSKCYSFTVPAYPAAAGTNTAS